jgi:hypothetical protein
VFFDAFSPIPLSFGERLSTPSSKKSSMSGLWFFCIPETEEINFCGFLAKSQDEGTESLINLLLGSRKDRNHCLFATFEFSKNIPKYETNNKTRKWSQTIITQHPCCHYFSTPILKRTLSMWPCSKLVILPNLTLVALIKNRRRFGGSNNMDSPNQTCIYGSTGTGGGD